MCAPKKPVDFDGALDALDSIAASLSGDGAPVVTSCGAILSDLRRLSRQASVIEVPSKGVSVTTRFARPHEE